jgi:hypothetical protein
MTHDQAALTVEQVAELRQRIARLGQRNQQTARALVALVAVVGVGLLSAARFNRAETITASRFVLRDADNKIAAELENGPKGPRLFLYGDDGQSRVGLFTTETTAGLVLNTTELTRKVTMYASDEETGINLDRRGKLRSVVAVQRNGTTAFVTKDDNGDARLTLIEMGDTAGMALTRKPAKENAALLINSEGTILEMIDSSGKYLFRKSAEK